MRYAPLTLLLGLSAGCKKDSTGPQGPLAGQWVGVGSGFTLAYTLTDKNGGDLSGSGTFSGATISGGSVTVDCSGKRIDSAFSLRLAAGTRLAVDEGAALVNDSTTQATLNGSGFVNQPVTLYRQR